MRVNTKELSQAVTFCRKATGKTCMPILNGAVAEIRDREIRLSATDLEIQCRATVSVSGDGVLDGMVLRDLARLEKLLAARVKAKIVETEIEVSNNSLVIAGVGFDLISLEEYPNTLEQLPDIPADSSSWLIDWSVWDSAIKHASKDQTRFNLNGVCFDSEQIVATDGHRLYWSDIKVTSKLPARPIVPSAINPALRYLSKHDAVMVFGDRSVTVMGKLSTGIMAEVRARLIGGEYPDWKLALPSRAKACVHKIKGELLTNALVAMKPMCLERDKKAPSVMLEVMKGQLSVKDYQTALCVQETNTNGLAFQGWYNVLYLLDAVPTRSQCSITIPDDSFHPIVVHTEQGQSLIMPMKG